MTELVGSYTASISKLEMQMRDISREQNPKQKGTLPSDTIANPMGSGSGPTSHCMDITTQSGKVLQGESEQVVEVEESEQEVRHKLKSQLLLKLKRPPPPFPQRVARKVEDSKLENFYDILKQLSVNISFVEAFQEMTGFAKYLKDLITKKKTTKNEVVNVTHRHQLNASCYLQASGVRYANAYKYEVANGGSFHKETGGNFEKEIPIILGIPFLATGRALMDLERNEIKFRVNDEEVTFQARKGMKLPHEYESISVINVVDEVEDEVEMKMEEQCLGEALAAILVNFDGKDMEGYMESINALERLGSYTYAPKKLSLDLENRVTPPSKPSIIEPPQLELKPLPPHLRYKFLGSYDTLPVIISSLLNDVQVEQLLNVLKEHRQAIGWTIADIRGIPAEICKHKIQLENESKPSVEHQ
ncbi:uncharacterized protein [Nicotiana sylvestris]|uniref:uncharacterized protein n=1 Tax=Nicotiana sylvestris TaxID=4096 RepID=UPI00388CEC6F